MEDQKNKGLYWIMGSAVAAMVLICGAFLAMAEHLDKQQAQSRFRGYDHKKVPVAHYVWDPTSQGLISVKINEFKWNDDHSLICVPMDKQHGQYSCFSPELANFE